MDQSQLLKELRIDRSAPPARPPARGVWIVAAVVLALAAAGVAGGGCRARGR